MTKFPNLLNTLEGLVNKYAHSKTFVHKDEILKGHILEINALPLAGLHTPSQAVVFVENETIAVFFTEDEDFIQIHDSSRPFISFLNPCLLKLRYQSTDKERISVQMHLFQVMLHACLVQGMICGEVYEDCLEELQHLCSEETMRDYLKVKDWIHRNDNTLPLAA